VGNRAAQSRDRKVLADRRHATGRETCTSSAKRADRLGRSAAPRSPMPRRSRNRVEHGAKLKSTPCAAKLRGDDVGGRRAPLARRVAVVVPEPAELSHRRNRRETLAKSLYSPAFLIDADRQRRLAQALDVLGERASCSGFS